ncbi:hypothetical protein [Pseudomonas sp. H2_E05]
MNIEEFGEFVFSFESEYGFNPYVDNAGGSGSQGGCGGAEDVVVAEDVMEEVVAAIIR